MVKFYAEGIYLVNGTEIVPESEGAKVQALTGKAADKEEAKKIIDNSSRLPEFYKTFDEREIEMAEKFCQSFYERYGIAAAWMTTAA